MQELDAAEIAHHAAREGTDVRTLVWIQAKNRSTGALEEMGLWTGDDHQDFIIDGVTRTYHAAGTILDVGAIISGTGLEVRMHTITISHLAPEVVQLIRGYDVRLAPVEIHETVRDLSTGNPVAAPRPVFRGFVNEAPITTPKVGGTVSASLVIASAVRSLTRGIPLLRSDAALRERSATDGLRQYADTSGEVGVWWGEIKADSAPVAPAAPSPEQGDRLSGAERR